MLNAYDHALYSSVYQFLFMDGFFISLFVFKMETPNLIPSPAGSVFKVPEKNDQIKSNS